MRLRVKISAMIFPLRGFVACDDCGAPMISR
jgi:hypothetical protein